MILIQTKAWQPGFKKPWCMRPGKGDLAQNAGSPVNPSGNWGQLSPLSKRMKDLDQPGVSTPQPRSVSVWASI